MKPHDYAPKRIIDPKAETIEELMPYFGVGARQMRQKVYDFLASGEWEQVFKMVNGKRRIAYRVKK